MTKINEEIVCTYKKEGNPNKKVKLLAICHLLKIKKPSPKYRKYYSRHTIRSRTGGRHLRKTEYEDWKQKNTWPSAKDQKQNTLEFMETKTKEGQYIVPEDIARDLKNELDVDYSPSGMRNVLHRINYTCKTMEPGIQTCSPSRMFWSGSTT